MFGNKYKYTKIPKADPMKMAGRTRKKGIVIDHIYKNEKNHKNLQNKTLINPLGNFYRRRRSSVVPPNLGTDENALENTKTDNLLEIVAEVLKESKEDICENNVKTAQSLETARGHPVYKEEFNEGYEKRDAIADSPVNPWIRRSFSEQGHDEITPFNGKTEMFVLIILKTPALLVFAWGTIG